ncbi:2Fe-2S iron-sulfur cluster-binding protein [Streptomyces sp. RB6PN25]|uniref:2Fe-2S iron-sulfur cluster-binding protein n=1 Tax=Streptomyces humicola TaxID=2953240 RepID=A0ABT1PND9_9ACTN|nr:2Fe-2S iron-sulfur cluster-binding protein [Streptomyces humicola]MCQ4079191.1 2Fe-2S iron-sulfur cluster-binding protein [Streptomyces humicola]
MPKVTYELPDGTVHDVDVPCGQSVMDGSVRNNLPGIVAECGGSCSCATCHVFLEAGESFFDEPTDEERELLEFAEGVRPNSRLSCQLIISDGCAAVRVTVPGTNG